MAIPQRDLAELLLPDDLLHRFRERAATHDRDNTFFEHTLADLRARGYLKLLVPTDLGGLGGSLGDAALLQRRLAGADPAAALGVNMHLIVTGAAGMAVERGLGAARRVLELAAAGELFAFGISEAGNDLMLFDAVSTALPDGAGGYAVTGTKIFTSMAHAWTRLVVHAKVAGEDGDARLVFGILERTPEVEVVADWDAHGMRATDSCTTRLRGAPLRAENVLATTVVGPDQDPLRFGIFGCFEVLIASVYCGLGERAVAVATAGASARRSITKGITAADDPHVRWRLASAAIAMDGAALQVEKLAHDLDALVAHELVPGATDHGRRWYLQLSGLKSRVTEAAIHAVDECVRAGGGRHYYLGSELERLSRDVRAAIYQPSSEESVRSSYARAMLGEIGADRG